ncbi:5-formyltetrahydrofolate cyclo-ligase [Litorimonas cladophorae]|uniref:5-formyltetrahydrofolate cyclo-ligase n=1 Tax=Litorimonas cladophorae TaxID=1220491 RepID=A0A918KNI2_9PROT|nr:5-formyltetrahydrofolate cyclo-ligase [Litorimonas cladophorae]GGX70419.1 5-formyltetrahydrofolate cyclo-ligase [Litorimonas cladophorae]
MTKAEARAKARLKRNALHVPDLGTRLIQTFPPQTLRGECVAGFAPINDEIDIWPLLHHLHGAGRQIVLPVITAPATPLRFRLWTPDCEMATDRYGVQFPAKGPFLTPQLILVPLLAFTADGRRLGYGGGYYDRTLAALRSQSDVFACGVAYAGQEVPELPTDAHDARLDAVLTETDFRIMT